MKIEIKENDELKIVRSESYNYDFNKRTGFFARWGKTKEDDPQFSPAGPEILDIEISTICNGIGTSMDTRKPCPWCYKSNTKCGENMSLETFKKIFHKIADKKITTQIAFGIGDIDGNPELFDIMNYCRENGVIPNITTNGMGVDDEVAQKLANVCGAVSVSIYQLNDVCFDAVEKLSKAKENLGATLQAVNIHQLLAEETYDGCFKLLDNIKNDSRLAKLGAVVFLSLKPKGNRNKYHSLSDLNKFNALIKKAQDMEIGIGFDSCTAPHMLKYAESFNKSDIINQIEPCESGLFSFYLNVKGEAFPCSFTEGTKNWEKGISILKADNFLEDVWYSERVKEWRNNLLSSSSSCKSCSVKKYCRSCLAYNITPCLK